MKKGFYKLKNILFYNYYPATTEACVFMVIGIPNNNYNIYHFNNCNIWYIFSINATL